MLFLLMGHFSLATSGLMGQRPLIQAISFVLIMVSFLFLNTLSTITSKRLAILIPFLYLISPASDDINRYIWEGQMLLEGINPYLSSPSSADLIQYRDDLFWPNINHKNLTAAYPPIVQWVFASVLSIGASPYWSIKILMLVFFLMSSLGIWKALHHMKMKQHRILLWAANPFALVFLVGEAHFDIMMICALVWAFYYQIKSKYVASALLLGFSICIKYFSLFTLPLFWNKNWKWANLLFIIPFTSLLSYDGIFQSLKTFGNDYRFNSFAYSIVEGFSGQFGLFCVLGILAIVLAFHTATEPVLNQNIMYCTLALTAFLPTIHPWYLCLSIPWLVFYPLKSLWVLQLTLFIGLLPMYSSSYQSGTWAEIIEMRYFIWLPFMATWIFEVWQSKRQHSYRHKFKEIRSLKVIIPIHKESKNLLSLHTRLTQAFRLLSDSGVQAHFQFIHSGVEDGCKEIAEAHDMPFIIAQNAGRGYQIREGLLDVQDDLICILHADTQFHHDHFLLMVQHMNRLPFYYSGWCPMDFDHTQGLSLVRILNSFRAKSLQITFGDQMQFFRKEAIDYFTNENIEFLPPMQLMEDVEIAMKLKELGPSLCLPSPIRASSRRWQSTNRWRNAFIIISLCTLYLFARRFGWAPNDTHMYQRLYYGK